MPDREKVIKELHDARRYLENKEWSDRGASPHIDAINDALALLKEQDEIIQELLKVGYPHNFQREEPWIRNYMYAITDVIKKAVRYNNDSD